MRSRTRALGTAMTTSDSETDTGAIRSNQVFQVASATCDRSASVHTFHSSSASITSAYAFRALDRPQHNPHLWISRLPRGDAGLHPAKPDPGEATGRQFLDGAAV